MVNTELIEELEKLQKAQVALEYQINGGMVYLNDKIHLILNTIKAQEEK